MLLSHTRSKASPVPYFAITLVLALLGAMAFSGANAPLAGASPSILAQAKKKCKAKEGVAKKKCINKTVKRLKAKAKREKGVVGVMSRNVFLGADLGPAIAATGFNDFITKNGQILRDVDTNNFKVRARGLASEIKSKSPDLVGLQEVALWRTGPVDLNAPITGNYTASEVHLDSLVELMAQLNKGQKRYRVVRSQDEFDFEAPADYNQVAGDGNAPGINDNGEINGRLTMRDVILAKVGSDIKTRNPMSGNFDKIYKPLVSGLPVDVNRGWVSTEVKVRNSPWFKFANTHLESFGDDKNKVVDCMTAPAPAFVTNPVSVRCTQAKELYDKVVAPSTLPVLATGDFNSDDDTVVDANCPSVNNTNGSLVGNNGGACGDTFAFNALKSLGMTDVSTQEPMSCCLNSDILTADQGSLADFDHHIDHVMTNRPAKVKKISSAVTGLAPVNGYWNSDHAGVYSKLKLLP